MHMKSLIVTAAITAALLLCILPASGRAQQPPLPGARPGVAAEPPPKPSRHLRRDKAHQTHADRCRAAYPSYDEANDRYRDGNGRWRPCRLR